MKRFLTSTFAAIISIATLATVASAVQVTPGHEAADINGDGEVTLTELKNYNRDLRQE